MAKSTDDMLKALKITSLKDFSEKQIRLIYNEDIVKPNKKKLIKNKNTTPPIDKNDEKYKIALKFINKLLESLKKSPITDLEQFQNIDREDIISDTCMKILTEMEKELFNYFDKKKSSWYNRKIIKNYVITFLKYMCKNIGYNFEHRKKTIQNNSINKTHTLYSITPNKV